MATRSPDAAVVFADAFTARFGTDAVQRLPAIAEAIGLKIVEVEADAFEGMLRRIKGRMLGTIALSRSVGEPRRRNFTVLHEIAHYVLPTHADSSSPCRPRDIERWDPCLRARELEANRFAAAALMPRAAVVDLFSREPSFDAIETLADRQRASLTAAAYRYVELSGERVAIVWSEQDEVKWAKTSELFYRGVKRGPLDNQSFAARAFRGKAIPDQWDRVDPTAWFADRNLKDSATILEHSKVLGQYGVLTLLWIDEAIEAWTEDGDEGLI